MSKFQKRHYEAIAGVLKANRPEPLGQGSTTAQQSEQYAAMELHDIIVNGLSSLFSYDNPNFQWDRFRTAAGMEI